MTLPADEAGHPGYHGVVADQTVGEQCERPTDDQQGRHSEQHGHRGMKRGSPVHGLHQRDELADENGDQRVDQSDRETRHEHSRIQPAGLSDEVPVERDEPARRPASRQLSRSNTGFEECEHGLRPNALRRALVTQRRFVQFRADTGSKRTDDSAVGRLPRLCNHHFTGFEASRVRIERRRKLPN